jgi:hypothetical protein
MNPRRAYKFKAAERFWTAFYALSDAQKRSMRAAWRKFKADPFDPALGTHKVRSLSARIGKTVYSVVIEADLRAVFIIEANTVFTFDVGTHSIYR